MQHLLILLYYLYYITHDIVNAALETLNGTTEQPTAITQQVTGSLTFQTSTVISASSQPELSSMTINTASSGSGTTEQPTVITQQVTSSLTFQTSTVISTSSLSELSSMTINTASSGRDIKIVGGVLGTCVVVLVIIIIISCGGIYLLVKSHSKQKADSVPAKRRAENDPSTHFSLSEEKLVFMTPRIPMSINESYVTTLSPDQAYGSINTDEQLYSSIDGEENVSIIQTRKNVENVSTHDIVTVTESHTTTLPLSPNQAYSSTNPNEQMYDYIDEKENDFNIKTEKNEPYISTPHITLNTNNTNESYTTVIPPTPNDSNGPCKEEEELYI